MKPSPERNTKPIRSPADFDVELVWHEEVDRSRARRVANILADILDNAPTPAEIRKP